MLIPIGFFGAGGASGSYELISTVFGTGASNTITFSSIPQTYKHLQVRVVVRAGGTSGSSGTLCVKFNNDTTTTLYRSHGLSGNGSSVNSYETGAWSLMDMGSFVYNGATANVHGNTIIDVLDYASTAKNKTFRAFSGFYNTSTNRGVALLGGARSSLTSAVDSLTFTTNDASPFLTTSRFSLYGIKGA